MLRTSRRSLAFCGYLLALLFRVAAFFAGRFDNFAGLSSLSQYIAMPPFLRPYLSMRSQTR